jgi:hypothetical protein
MSAILLLLASLPGQTPAVPEGPRKDDLPVPRVKERRADIVLAWNVIALDAIRRDRTAPPVAARNLAVLHVAVADAVRTIYPDWRPYRVSLRATEEIDPQASVAVTAHRVLVALYPSQRVTLDRELKRALDAVPAGTAKTRAGTLGRHVADRILTWRQRDLLPRESAYRPSWDVGLWRPTPPLYAAALLPAWGETAPFGVRNTDDHRPKAPPLLTSKEYTKDFNEVKDLGGSNSLARTAEESIIAWFWNDGGGTCTPPGHWNQIAQEVAIDQGRTLPENARIFALLNIALADAAIACWDSKYRFRLWRPVTAIREADRDGNPDTARDARWESLLPTPPFPSYTSGHSTFSGAAATILEKLLGRDQVEFSIGSDGYPGQRRSYRGFWHAAREAGRSRIYGGIHYECDNREGLDLGRRIAEEVYQTRLVSTQSQARLSSR